MRSPGEIPGARGLTVIVAGLLPLTAHGFKRATTDQGVALSWPGSCVVYHINEEGSEDEPVERAVEAIVAAFDTWGAVEGSYIRFVYGGLTDLTTTGAGSQLNLVRWVEEESDWTLVDRDILGATAVTYDADFGIILSADIEMNGAYFEFTSEEDVVDYDIQAAVIHEVGHLIGLDHSEVPEAAMHTEQSQSDLSKRTLSADDLAAVTATYPLDADPGVCDESEVGDFYSRTKSVNSSKAKAAATTTGCSTGEDASQSAWGLLLSALLLLLGGRQLRTLAAPLLMALVLCAPSVADAYKLYTSPDNPNVPLRWFAEEAALCFDSTPPSELTQGAAQTLIEDSFQQWCHLSCSGQATPFDFQFGCTKKGRAIGYIDEDGAENENLVMWVTSAAQWGHGAEVLALTSLTYDTVTGEIVDADLELNDPGFDFSDNPDNTQADVMNTVVHEAGHVLGLDHSLNPAATMFSKAPLGEITKRDLANDDVNGFCALYGPDAPAKLTTPDPVPDPGGGGNGTCTYARDPGGSPLGMTLTFMLMFIGAFAARQRDQRRRLPSESR